MGVLDRFNRRMPPPPNINAQPVNHGEYNVVDMRALMASDTIDLVDINDDSILIVEAPQGFEQPVQLAVNRPQVGPELGRSATQFGSYLREEYNSELRGLHGLQKYDRMRRGDAATRSALRTLKTPITGATWFVEPAGDDMESHEIAQFVEKVLQSHMTYTWSSILSESLLMLDFGYYMFEKVWEMRKINGVERLIYRKLAPRHPLDVVDWNFDANGGPISVDMYDSVNAPGHVRIPIEKLAVFTYDQEAGDIQGISVLRSAYKHWYFKENAYKIDAIQKERHGIGIPIIKLPPGFTPADKTVAQELGRNLRTNEKAHVVLPPMWEIMFAKLEGQPVSALETADHHTKMIYQNVLAQAMYAEQGGDPATMMELFYKGTRQIANIVANTMNQYCIPDLVKANWDVDDLPKLKVRKLGDTQEARTISFALRNLVGAGIIQVDDHLEAWAREVIDAPRHDPNTLREIAKPQMPKAQPAKVGPPRQAQAKNQQNQPGKSAGRDGGGGGGGTS